VGLQGHWSVYEPSESELQESISRFAGLGLAVQVTELDVSVHVKEHGRRERTEADNAPVAAEAFTRQAAQYEMLFSTFRKNRGALTGVTFWNVSDKTTWLDNFPVRGRKDYPLLFDEKLQPKPFFNKIVDF